MGSRRPAKLGPLLVRFTAQLRRLRRLVDAHAKAGNAELARQAEKEYRTVLADYAALVKPWRKAESDGGRSTSVGSSREA